MHLVPVDPKLHLACGKLLRRGIGGVLRVKGVHFGRDSGSVNPQISQHFGRHAPLGAHKCLEKVMTTHGGVPGKSPGSVDHLVSGIGPRRHSVRRVLEPSLEHLPNGGPNRVEIMDLVGENPSGKPLAFPLEGEKDVLGPDVVVLELQGFPQGQLEQLLGSRREGNVPRSSVLPSPGSGNDGSPNRRGADPQLPQNLSGDAGGHGEQPEQDVLGTDVTVPKLPSLFLGPDNDGTRFGGKSLKHATDGPPPS